MPTREEEFLHVAMKQLDASTQHKQPRMDKLKMYEEVYNGKEKPRLRIQFAVPLPVLSGMVDSLRSDFDDELDLRFKSNHPADKQTLDITQKIWDVEAFSLTPNARWDLKSRWDKFLAVMSGRSIQKTFCESDPRFGLNFDIVDYRFFHNEPKGGGLLENHLFVGEESIFRTEQQLINGAIDGVYLKEGVKKMLSASGDPSYKSQMQSRYGDKLARFESMGFSVDNNNYVGEKVFNLCEWQLTYKGKRWYMLFDPWSMAVVRLEENKEVFESNLWMYTSWSTHEDPKNFWNKSYTDDFYPIHDGIYTLFNQELTNRQKRNLGAKAVDMDVFEDLVALDDANSRPDKIVPVKLPPGKSIQDAVFMFETPELTGTIDLTNWMKQNLAQDTGVEDIKRQANMESGTGAQVMYTSLQSAAKRLNFKARSFQEAYSEVGLRAFHGMQENLSEEEAVRIIGVDGVGWKSQKMQGRVSATVISKSEADRENVLKADKKLKTLDRILASEALIQEVNPKKLVEIALENGEFKSEEIEEIMDKQQLKTGTMNAKADIAILKLRKGKIPELVYDATDGFVQKIIDFEKDHRNQLGELSNLFYDYIEQHLPIVQENMMRLADQMNMNKGLAPVGESEMETSGLGNPQMQMLDKEIV